MKKMVSLNYNGCAASGTAIIIYEGYFLNVGQASVLHFSRHLLSDEIKLEFLSIVINNDITDLVIVTVFSTKKIKVVTFSQVLKKYS